MCFSISLVSLNKNVLDTKDVQPSANKDVCSETVFESAIFIHVAENSSRKGVRRPKTFVFIFSRSNVSSPNTDNVSSDFCHSVFYPESWQPKCVPV